MLRDIFTSVADIYQGRAWLDTEGFERNGRISYNRGLALAKETFTTLAAGAAEDLGLLIQAEKAFVTQELEFCPAEDKTARSSLTAAIQSFDDAQRALTVVVNPEAYKYAERTYPRRGASRYHGMPRDAFHIACDGHKTRIQNIIRVPGLNLTEKTVLMQRSAAIAAAQAAYYEKQQAALKE